MPFLPPNQQCQSTEGNYWDLLSKLEFMQWEDVDCPTFTSMCNSAINWLDYGNSFSGIQVGCLWQTICFLERQLLVSIMQNQHSSYSMSLTKLVIWEFDFFMTMHQHTSHWLLSKLSATVNLLNWTILPPSDYFLKINLKYHLRGTWFTDDESLTIAVEA